MLGKIKNAAISRPRPKSQAPVRMTPPNRLDVFAGNERRRLETARQLVGAPPHETVHTGAALDREALEGRKGTAALGPLDAGGGALASANPKGGLDDPAKRKGEGEDPERNQFA